MILCTGLSGGYTVSAHNYGDVFLYDLEVMCHFNEILWITFGLCGGSNTSFSCMIIIMQTRQNHDRP